MINSILEDIKIQFRDGNMLTRIIMINVLVFAVVRIIIALTGFSSGGSAGASHELIKWLAIPSGFMDLLKKPWTLITHMFLHYGFWHLVWNMLWFYWFARIIGDFLGDRRVLPLYLLGGLAGAVLYLISDHLFPTGSGGHSIALGASAATSAFTIAAATLSPDYEFNLILLGRIKIKYIAAVKIFLDIIEINGPNSGGHYGHLGGAILGFAFVYYLREGTDITLPLQKLFSPNAVPQSSSQPARAKKRSPIKVVYKNPNKEQPSKTENFEDRLDIILDKIKKVGIENLSEEEKAFLDAASKKD